MSTEQVGCQHKAKLGSSYTDETHLAAHAAQTIRLQAVRCRYPSEPLLLGTCTRANPSTASMSRRLACACSAAAHARSTQQVS